MDWLSGIFKTINAFSSGPIGPWVLRKYLNHKYQSFGVMTSLQIDSAKKTASLELDLKGETQPLRITISRYQVTREGGRSFIEIKELNTSREWVTSLARQLVKDKKFAVPEFADSVL